MTEVDTEASDDRPNVLRCVAIGAVVGAVSLVIMEAVATWMLPGGPPGAVAILVGIAFAIVAMLATAPLSALDVSVTQNLVWMVPLGGAIWGGAIGLVYGGALKLASLSRETKD